jgi:hypothetical protein
MDPNEPLKIKHVLTLVGLTGVLWLLSRFVWVSISFNPWIWFVLLLFLCVIWWLYRRNNRKLKKA